MMVLPIGDCHITDGQDLSRFDVLGKFILENKPETIVIMGDFITLQCLSAWDRNKRMKMEGQRYSAEIEAANDALDRMMRPVKQYNKERRKHKKKQYTPAWIYIKGNHEDRLDRYLDIDPTFAGHVSVEKDLKLEQRGFTVVPYREYYYIDGIGFTHIPFNKMKEVGGVDITRKVQAVNVISTVFAHTHELHVSNCCRQGQHHLQQVLNVGCFFEEHEDYVAGRMTQYWKGLILMETLGDGGFDFSTHRLGALRRAYGIAQQD